MLGTPAMARAVADLLARAALPAVVDPVLSASSGAALFQGGPDAARAAYSALWPHAVLTPNAPEVRVLLGLPEDPRDVDALEAAARELVRRGAKAALVKGGHAGGAEAVDVVCTPEACERFAAPRLAGAVARGTGCRLASALAAGLSRGEPLPQAVRRAKELVTAYLAAGRFE
jgi:hydroxymethylpyrimidine/phosphomethylpyrimidine kinase